MRIKLIIENAGGIKKRKLCYLVDKEACSKVADVMYLIRKRFFQTDGKVSLYLDGFFIPPQEELDILKENDIISVRFAPEITSKDRQGDESSSSDSDSDHILQAFRAAERLPHQPVVQKACNIPSKSPIENINILKKTVEKKSNAKETVVPNTVSRNSTDKRVQSGNMVTSSKVGTVKVKRKKVSSSDSSDSSGSSDSSDSSDSGCPPKVGNKKAPIRKVPVNGDVTSKNGPIKKTVPLSKLGFSSVKQNDVSSSDSSEDSSSSSEEDFLTKKKDNRVINQTLSKQTVPKQPLSKTSEVSNNKIHGKVKNITATEKNKTNCSGAKEKKCDPCSSSGTSDSSSDSSDGEGGNNNNDNDKTKNISNGIKDIASFELHVSKLLKKSSNPSSTPSCAMSCASSNNKHQNNKSVAVGNLKAKKMAQHDVLKNKSQFLVSKPVERDVVGDPEDSTTSSLNASVFDSSMDKSTFDVNDSASLGVPKKSLRNRRRKQVRKQNQQNRQLIQKAEARKESESEVKQATSITNGVTFNVECNGVESVTTTSTESTHDNSKDGETLLATSGDCSTISVDNNTTEEIAKEACMKGFVNKDLDVLELKITEDSLKKTAGASGETGILPHDINEDCAVELQNTVSLNHVKNV